jgi:hypothetical protein
MKPFVQGRVYIKIPYFVLISDLKFIKFHSSEQIDMAYPYIASWLPFLDSSKIRTVYDYKFEKTPDHLSEEVLDKYRLSYDELAAKAIEQLEEKKQERNENSLTQKPNPYELLLREAALGENNIIAEFWDQAHSVPDWVDWNSIERGQNVSLFTTTEVCKR